ncbi:MAG: protein kinase domain-containing protein [Acidobacteriota bacterium]
MTWPGAHDRFGEKLKTQGGTILGTPAYMAPEQCKGTGEVAARADLYALGCILFELLTGCPPFVAQGGGETMAMHIYEPAPRVATFAPHLPAELDALVARLLVKSPADRTPSAAYARAATHTPPAGPMTQYLSPPDEPAGTPRWIPAVVILVALAIAAAAVYFIAGSTPTLGSR